MVDFFLEKVCLPLFHLSFGPLSLWQALFVLGCALACRGVVPLLRSLPRATLVYLAAAVLAGCALRLALSPRNLLDSNYRGQGRIAAAAWPGGFRRAATLEGVRGSCDYYLGYGHQEFLRMSLGGRPGSPAARAFTAGGAVACLQPLLVFLLALLLLRDERTALWCAALAALSPASIRQAFSDGVYVFGAAPMLLALIQGLLFARTGSRAALAAAIALSACAASTHAAFLPVPLLALGFCLAGLRDSGMRSNPRGWALGALFLLPALPALLISPLPFGELAGQNSLASRPLGYAIETLSFLFSRDNPFFDLRFASWLVWLLCAGGAAALARRKPLALAQIAAAIFLLELPVVLVSGSPNAALVKHAHILPLYLLAAAFGAARAIELLSERRRTLGTAALLAGIALGPVLHKGMIVKEYNLQREFSFLRRTLASRALEKELFVLGNGFDLIDVIAPGRHAAAVVNAATLKRKGEPPDEDDPAALAYLDCLVDAGRRPMAYLPLRCYYPSLEGMGSRGLRPECSRFLERYSLAPVAEESFASEAYCPGTDLTAAQNVVIGFYRVTARSGAKGGSRACRKPASMVSSVMGSREPTPQESLASQLGGLLASGPPEKARLAARAAVRRFPKDSGLWLIRAQAEHLAGDERAALRSLAAARALSRTVEERRAAALVCQQLGRHRLALSLLYGLLLESSGDASLHRDKGVCLFLAGSPDLAARSLERAVELDPRLLSAYLSLGSVYRAAGRERDAREVFDRALSLPDPEEPELRQAIREARAGRR